MSERIVWRTAEPLWSQPVPDTDAPAVLRFAGDDFMDRFAASVACDGDGLAPLVAGRETWRQPGAGLGTAHAVDRTDPVTLFQPTHGRFYLVTASLVCRRYGHPDRAIDPGADESVGYVLRRLEPSGPAPVDVDDDTTYAEHGWTTAIGDGAWIPADRHRLATSEDRQPLFPVVSGGERRLHAGLLPVSKREALEARPPRPSADEIDGDGDPMAPLADPRLAELDPLIVELQQVRAAASAPPPRAVLAESLFYAMADVARWLDEHLPGALAGSVAIALLDGNYGMVGGQSLTRREALQRARDEEADAVFADDEVPALVNTSRLELRRRAARLVFGGFAGGDDDTASTSADLFVQIAEALEAADEAGSAAGDGTGEGDADAPPAGATTTPGGVYVVRFVYERPHCRPAERLVVSRASRPFRFAPFHDPDAPARPVRIALPVDTSPGGLRRFPKNVSVVLSSELRKQMQQVSERTLRDDELDDGPPVNFGMLCQLSIPIITICALILLMIIVSLLNLVFFWIPLFKVCLPLPRRDGS